MSKKNCELIKDLLPLYADEVCSEESRKAVAEHISQCDECRKELEKMGQHIAIGVNKDISVIKRIKRRVWIERIVIAGIAAMLAVFVLFMLKMIYMDSWGYMDYEDACLNENLWVEEDENGDLWLVKKGAAAESSDFIPTLRDANGNYFGDIYQDFDKESVEAYGVTLTIRRILNGAEFYLENKEERTLLFNINEKENMNEVFYFDEENKKEYILWERN